MQIIVLEDTKEYISYAPKDETEAQDRRPFDLLVCPYLHRSFVFFFRRTFSLKCKFINSQVIINPKLEKKSNKTALFFEGCLR